MLEERRVNQDRTQAEGIKIILLEQQGEEDANLSQGVAKNTSEDKCRSRMKAEQGDGDILKPTYSTAGTAMTENSNRGATYINSEEKKKKGN